MASSFGRNELLLIICTVITFDPSPTSLNELPRQELRARTLYENSTFELGSPEQTLQHSAQHVEFVYRMPSFLPQFIPRTTLGNHLKSTGLLTDRDDVNRIPPDITGQ